MEGKLAPSHCSKWKKARAAVRRRNIYYCGNDTSTQFFAASVAEELLPNTELTEESKDRAIHLLKKFSVQNMRFSLAVRNPFVITGWDFGDPEGGDTTLRTVNFGVNFTL